MKSLEGQVAFITGAGTGIGAAIARALAAEGISTVLTGRRPEPLYALAEKLGEGHLAIPMDVRDETEVQAAVAQTVSRWGRLDILVNNAGIFRPTPFEETTLELFEENLSANLTGAFLASKAAWPHLKASQGQILNLSSIAGIQGFSGSAAYCASKFGLNGLSQVLALEGKEHGIRVLVLCPGSIDTAMWEPLADEATRERMMKPSMVADQARHLLTSPRGVEFGPVVLSNFNNPFG